MLFLGLLYILTSVFFTCDGLSYRNYALLHGTPRNTRELKFFNNMVKLYNVTFWRRPGKVMGPVEFTISPFNYGELMIDTYRTKIRFRTIMEDVQSAFDEQIIRHYFRNHLDSFNWNYYHSLEDIYNWLRDLSGANPDELQLLHIGKSFEKRDIFAVKLTLNKVKICKKRHRPKVIIEGGCHGREWISPAVVTYMIHALLNANSSNSEELTLVAPMYDWYFVPVMNPDGYVYSQTQDRLWQKNRREGYGVDLNRNFGIVFGSKKCSYIYELDCTEHGDKMDKKSEDYCGTEPFSEPESAAMASFARDNSFSLEYYVSFHSYGQYIIIPYSFSETHEESNDDTKKLADMMAQKIFRKYQVEYKVGTNFDTQGYLASGVSADWVKRAINVTHAATIMLPDTGVYGFALPPDQILPTCQAIMDGLLAFFDPPQPDDVRKLRNELIDEAGLLVPFSNGATSDVYSPGILFSYFLLRYACIIIR